MRLRVVHREDLPQLAHIEESCSSSPWGMGMLGEAMGLEGAWGWGIEEGGRLLGFGLFLKVLDEMQVLTLCVLPEHRRRGCGRRLMEEAEHLARELGMEKLSLEVRQSNLPALTLYGHLGFIRVGCRKAYYKDGEDAVLMDRPLRGGEGGKS
ncbi:MAG: ribosomal protein S18-alanine N-acetyltransferase [Cystobacterineae bacterium]|nr:ribosomal protein S18-alanine N-acetyltransferase [Cystobacterineae bacterium]